ncbi:MAG: hypothetical protein FJ095_08290 [Deltaproteobacteria bacterium]|nr:hypothetical protein [Deltaproteobacteria bacterium]
MRRWLPYLGIALGIALVAYALFFVRSDEERIRERLTELASSVEVKDRRETPMIRAARVRKSFATLFSKEVRLAVPELGTVDRGREPLVDLTVSAQSEFASVALDLDGLSIRLDESKEHGLAVGTAKLSGTREDGTLSRDTRTVSLRLDRQEDEWRIVDVSVSPPADAAESKEGVAPLKLPADE